ncbi:MAG: AI-2E family transporter [Vulcanimicrobiaceae bacterium]
MTESPKPPTPRRRSRNDRRVTYGLKVLALISLAAVMLAAIVDFIGRIPSVAVIVIGAIFFTYIIYPTVHWLNARMPLIWAILLVYVGIAGVVAVGVSTVAPALFDDTQTLVKSMPQIVHTAQAAVSDPGNPIFARLPPAMRTYLAGLPPELAHRAQGYGGEAASRVLTLLASVVGLLATMIVIPVLSLYLLIEAPGLIRDFMRVIPLKAQPKALAVMHDLDNVLGGFIRGQLTVGATIGVCITIALLLLHVKYAVLIGVTAGLLDVIPYVGALVGFVPSVTLALANDGWQHALIVALVFAAIFQAEGHFIAPRIVSDSVGLTPLMVIIAILIGGELLGIAGMFIAVPIAAVLRIVILHAIPGARTPPTMLPVPAATVTDPPMQPGEKIAGLPVAEGPPSPSVMTPQEAQGAGT